MYLETAVFLPVDPAGIAQTAVHLCGSPGVPLGTLCGLATLAGFASHADHQHGIVAGDVTVTAAAVEDAAGLAVRVVVAVAQRHDCRG